MSTKRILSLVLALVMVLGTFGTVFAASTGNEKVDWLLEQGIVTGNESGDLMLDKTIDRASVAKMVVEALNSKAAAAGMQGYKAPFADVPVSHWSNGNIQVVNGLGLMIGNNGKFMPSAEISYNEVITILVRMVNGLTAEETKTAVWPATYIAKASDLGLLEGLTATNFGAAAIRQDILELFYNAMVNKEAGHYSIVKAIVLENDRITRVGANEVTVEVIKEVQRANFVDANRADLKGEQYTYELPAKYNAEDLLGKVVDLSINKDNKVVEVKVDTTYEVLTGAVSGITNSRLTINDKQYIVNLDERYNKEDERVYRTYLNDKDLKYTDFAKDNTEVEYARVTVKAGKVLFIDSYNFNDIMPVKEVKEVRTKDTIVAYDDIRNGGVIETTVSKARVILVNGKTFTRGTLEDVKADNVIHTYNVGTTTKYVVLQDKAIEGKLEKVKGDRNGEYAVVAGEEYFIPTTAKKEAVYEFQTDGKFYTLTAKDAYKELDKFRGEEVKVLLSLGEELQYIGSNVGFGEFMGVATRIVGKEMRVVTPDNKSVDYSANLDTVVRNVSTTAHTALNNIAKNSLVYVNAKEETLKKVVDFNVPVAINAGFTARNINNKRITDDTVVYVVNTNGSVEVRKIADVVKAYDALTAAKQTGVTVSFVTEDQFDAASVRGLKFANVDHVYAMVVYNLDITPAAKDAVYGKLVRYDNRTLGKSEITVELANGTRRTFTLDQDNQVNFVVGNIYAIKESKATENLALTVSAVTFSNTNYKEVKSIHNSLYTFTDNTTAYETRSTEIFGKRPQIGDKISFLLDGNDMEVIVNPGFGTNVVTTTGIVTYINTTVGSESFSVDNKTPYFLNAKTILTDKNNNVVAMGAQAVINALTSVTPPATGDQVEVTFSGDVMTIKRLALKSELTAVANLKAAQDAVTKAEGTKLQADVTAAQTLVTALPADVAPATTKADLQARLNALQLVVSLETAKAAVAKAEGSNLQADLTAAQTLVAALPADVAPATTKADLQARLNVVAAEIAVRKAEATEAQADVTTAQGLVTALPAGAAKTALQGRLTAVQGIIDAAAVLLELNTAKAEVEGLTNAEVLTIVTDVTAAAVKTKVENTVNGLASVTGKSFTVTVNETSFTAPDAGVSTGSYVFTVTLVKAGQTVTTNTVTITIPQ